MEIHLCGVGWSIFRKQREFFDALVSGFWTTYSRIDVQLMQLDLESEARWVCPVENLPLFSLYARSSFPRPMAPREQAFTMGTVSRLQGPCCLWAPRWFDVWGTPWACFTPIPQTVCAIQRNHTVI